MLVSKNQNDAERGGRENGKARNTRLFLGNGSLLLSQRLREGKGRHGEGGKEGADRVVRIFEHLLGEYAGKRSPHLGG